MFFKVGKIQLKIVYDIDKKVVLGDANYTFSDFELGKNDIWCESPIEDLLTQIHVIIEINKADENPTQKVYFYLNNLPCSSEKPLELIFDGKSVFKLTETIKAKEYHIFEGLCHTSLLKLGVKIPLIKLDHTREVDLAKNGEYFRICLDEVKKTLAMNQQFKAYEVESDMKIINTGSLKEEKKVEIVYLNLINLPGSKEDPFDIYFDTELIYKTEIEILDVARVLTVNLPKPTSKMKLIVKSKKYQPIEADLELGKRGNYLQLSLIHGEFDIKQRSDDNFPQIETVFQKEKFLFYLLYCKASKDKPLTIKFDDSTLQNLSDISKDVLGLANELTIPSSQGFTFEICENFRGLSQTGKLKVKNGCHIKIEILNDNQLVIEQQTTEFKFTYGKDNKICSIKEGNTVTLSQ